MDLMLAGFVGRKIRNEQVGSACSAKEMIRSCASAYSRASPGRNIRLCRFTGPGHVKRATWDESYVHASPNKIRRILHYLHYGGLLLVSLSLHCQRLAQCHL